MKSVMLLFILALVQVSGSQSAFAGDHSGTTGDHPGEPPFRVEIVELPAMTGAVIEGTLGGDIDALFWEMFAAVDAQELFNAETQVGSIFPFAMTDGWNADTVIYVGVSIADGAKVSAPLTEYVSPAGEYLMVLHEGPYATSKDTWQKTFAWAKGHGIEFGDGPAMERYLDNPEEVDEENLRTEIYIPLISGQGHEGMDNKGKHGHGEPPFEVDVIEIPKHAKAAYFEGTAGGDMGELFMSMIKEAMNQGLLTEDTKVGAIYPTMMSEGDSGDDLVIYAAISLLEGATAEKPFETFDVPPGGYLAVTHVGPYQELSATWEAAFTWAEGHGIKLGDGPALEQYLNNPNTTPPDELVTYILIPLMPGYGHHEGHGETEEQGDHGGHTDHSDHDHDKHAH